MSSIGDTIRTAREAKGWAQTDLAREAGVSQQTIAKIESGVTSRSRHMADIARALQIGIPELGITFAADTTPQPPSNHQPERRDRDLGMPVYTTSPSSRGQIFRAGAPIEYIVRPSVTGTAKGFGLYLVEREMQPAFDPGDVAIVHEALPPMPGTYCVFITQPDQDRTSRLVVRRLVAIEEDGWRVEQFNPAKTEILDASEWVRVQRVVGRYFRN